MPVPAPPCAAYGPGERLARLRLARTRRVGPVAFHALLARFGGAEAALAALPELARRGGGATPVPPSAAAAERACAEARRRGASLVVWGDAAYPRLLARIPDAPGVLTCIGDPGRAAAPCVAIVGARNASANGQRFARLLASELAAAGAVVVSGLARGIDTAAHEGAGAAATIAVVAGGADIVYPPENAALQDAIGRAGGAIFAEMPFGTPPQAHLFPRRNRIVAGLSAATIVVEATLRSGSLITARLALDQGREVLAVPGFPLDPRAAGPNALLRDGAAPATCAADILASLPPADDPPRAPERSVQASVPGEKTDLDQMDDTRRRILAALGTAPAPVDEVLRRCHLSAPSAQLALLELELAGRLQRHPGNQVSLVAQDGTGS
jgi:DNA processing protein